MRTGRNRMNTLSRIGAKELAVVILDDSGNVHYDFDKLSDKAKFVGFQCGFESHWIAVQSYLNCEISDCEAEEIATEYLEEKGWFNDSDENHSADYIL